MKLVASIILTFLLGAMFVSLFHMSTGMDMTGGMTDCPFMAHEEVICLMDLADHIGAWKTAFSAVMPLLLLLLGAAFVICVTVTAPNLFSASKPRYVPILYAQLRERTYSFSHRPLQDLFADGILHPKLF